MEDLLLQMYRQNIANQAGNLFDQRKRNLVNQAAMDVFSTGFDNRNTGIMQQAPATFSSLPPNLGIVNQPDEEETEQYEVDQFGYRKEPNKLGGILDLLAGMAIPGYGIIKSISQGGFEGLRGLGGRLGQSDFAQSSSHMEFLDRIRKRSAGTNDISAADLQTEMANRSSAAPTDQDRGRGDRPGGASYSAPSRASSYRDSTDFGTSFHGG